MIDTIRGPVEVDDAIEHLNAKIPRQFSFWFGTINAMRARLWTQAANTNERLRQVVYDTQDPEVFIWSRTPLPERLIQALGITYRTTLLAKPLHKAHAIPVDVYELALRQRAEQQGARV